MFLVQILLFSLARFRIPLLQAHLKVPPAETRPELLKELAKYKYL